MSQLSSSTLLYTVPVSMVSRGLLGGKTHREDIANLLLNSVCKDDFIAVVAQKPRKSSGGCSSEVETTSDVALCVVES